eukprot:gene6000-8262_t
MDRVKDIRLLMKQQQKSSTGVTNGKNKAKMLKLMKEQILSSSDIKGKSKIAVTTDTRHNLDDQSKPGKVVKKLPDDFFDSSVEMFGQAMNKISEIPSQSLSGNDIKTDFNILSDEPVNIMSCKTNELISLSKKTHSNENKETLPVGFFDDPIADNEARGISLTQLIEQKNKVVEEELKNLLTEIEEVSGSATELINEELVQEEEQKEADEEALQFVYMNKLAILLQKSDHVQQKIQQISNNHLINNEDEIYKESEEIKASVISTSNASNSSEIEKPMKLIEDDIKIILLNKLQEKVSKKRKLNNLTHVDEKTDAKNYKTDPSSSEEESDDEDYQPLNYLDWTSRII